MDHENRQPRTGPDGQNGGRREASPAPESAAPAKREDRPTPGAPGAEQKVGQPKAVPAPGKGPAEATAARAPSEAAKEPAAHAPSEAAKEPAAPEDGAVREPAAHAPNRTDKEAKGLTKESGPDPALGEEAQKAGEAPAKANPFKRPGSSRLTRRDGILMLIFTVGFALLNCWNLGSFSVPQTYWESQNNVSEIVLKLPEDQMLTEIWIYKNVTRNANLSADHDDDNYTYTLSVFFSELELLESEPDRIFTDEGGNRKTSQISLSNQSRTVNKQRSVGMFKWWGKEFRDAEGEPLYAHRYIGLRLRGPASAPEGGAGVRINEIVLLDQNGEIITPEFLLMPEEADAEHDAAKAFDEAELFPGTPSLKTDFYWDEIFFARTAYEISQGWSPSEITHPPLGKIILSWGISLFGMNPFGWRFMAVLFSVLLTPLAYFFGKKVFRRTLGAVLVCLLFALDGLHIVQGNIATVDTFVVFFIIAMYAAFLAFLEKDFLTEKPRKLFLPLGLSGVFFGMAASCKWTGIYAGGGLFILLCVALVKAFLRQRRDRSLTKAFWLRTLSAIAVCFVCFIGLGGGIYVLSYLPFLNAGQEGTLLEIFWRNQQYIWWHHAVHVPTTSNSNSSWWFLWPLNLSSCRFYNNDANLPDGIYARIHTFGVTATYWLCFAALVLAVIWMVRRKIKACRARDEKMIFPFPSPAFLLVMVGFLANYLPWVLIPRLTFTYHFYNAVPFYLCLGVGLLLWLRDNFRTPLTLTLGKRVRTVEAGQVAVFGILCAIGFNFLAFYPVFIGFPLPEMLANFMFRWVYFTGKFSGMALSF